MDDQRVEKKQRLLDRLAKAGGKKLTKDEIDKQRISMIYAGLSHESGMSKEDIKKVLEEAS